MGLQRHDDTLDFWFLLIKHALEIYRGYKIHKMSINFLLSRSVNDVAERVAFR